MYFLACHDYEDRMGLYRRPRLGGAGSGRARARRGRGELLHEGLDVLHLVVEAWASPSLGELLGPQHASKLLRGARALGGQ